MKKLFLIIATTVFCTNLHAKVVCSNQNLTYLADVKSFGIPKIPVGTSLGVKSFSIYGNVVAEKQFVVVNPNDWTDYQDWEYKVQLQNENIIWINPDNNNERVLTADLTFSDNAGEVLVSNEKVTCVINEQPMP